MSELQRLQSDVQDVIDHDASHRGMRTEIGGDLYSVINEYESDKEQLTESRRLLEVARQQIDFEFCSDIGGTPSKPNHNDMCIEIYRFLEGGK